MANIKFTSNITEHFKALDKPPNKPYAIFKQNNIVYYLQLSSTGTSKILLNNLHIIEPKEEKPKPSVSDGYLYLATDNGLKSMNLNNKKINTINNTSYNFVQKVNGYFLTSDNNNLYSFDTNNSQKYKIAISDLWATAYYSNTIYVAGSNNNMLYSYNSTNGQKLKTIDLADKYIYIDNPRIAKGKFLYLADENTLSAYYDSLSTVWYLSNAGIVKMYYCNNYLYFVDGDTLKKVDSLGNTTKLAEFPVRTINITLDTKGNIYVININNMMQKLDSTGKKIWEYKLDTWINYISWAEN